MFCGTNFHPGPAQPTTNLKPSPTVMTTTLSFERYGEMLNDVPVLQRRSRPENGCLFPDSGGPWPALVYVHGGSWMHGDKSEAAMFARGLNSMGYLVVSINYRLYPPATFPAMIEDVKCAIRSLRAHAADTTLTRTALAPWEPVQAAISFRCLDHRTKRRLGCG